MAPASSSAASTSVQVALRIRPTTTQDTHSIPTRFQRAVVHAAANNAVTIDAVSAAANGGGAAGAPAAPATPVKKQTFTFDHVLSPESTQHSTFSATAAPLLERFLDGFNCTILAYGQTSSGKTFTMTGIDLDADPADPTNGMGIIPRSVSTIFQRANHMRDERGGAWTYSLKGSFLELYNEDLIDLLAPDDGGGAKRDLQIREDKNGHIIWDGLREVPVRSASDVMGLIRKGTAIRRTNETDMNAQSSRSHAIFSLTLTQKKFAGSGPPPRSTSPLPSTSARSPSRLARPGSMFANHPASPASRLSMPSRPGTPTSTRGGLRPASSLGLRAPDASFSIDEEPGAGEWTTVVSKFHFVDLAGSERLKRTAAQGERIKEGISINSGLLALGNVISALGDPARAKSNTATYVPYRDSKLTRLLQDSLGGNAHTLMIACISPAEWNAAETLNTLKYANRARNIKNRAVVNEREEGWEDVEWLQSMVTRLRRELKTIKDGGALSVSSDHIVGGKTFEKEFRQERATRQQVAEENSQMSLELVKRENELMRLRQQLVDSHDQLRQGKNADKAAPVLAGTARYEEIVGPVIEEYEKTISAMEAELSLNRAALRHTNELVEEKEEELAVIQERHASTELYVEELRARVAKLSEREASTEAYVHDLEEKIKTYDESSINSTGSITDLKRELSRFKDTESHSVGYIADLEARLARSDESVLALQQTVERLEKDVERRSDEVESLQMRLDNLMRDGAEWRSELERREERVKDLEAKLEEWEKKRKEAGDERLRLGTVVDGVEQAKRELQESSRPTTPTTNGVNGAPSRSPSPQPNRRHSVLGLETQLASLQETHAATLADLSSVSSKYRDALREISDLAAQIQEAKLNNSSGDVSPEKPIDTPPLGTRRSRVAGDGSNRRLFFRHAASTESLHSRSLSQSLSLSQELSSAHSRKVSLSSATSNGTSSPLLSSPRIRPNLSLSLPNLVNGERSVASLEKEIIRLQEVLREREAEIGNLETSLKEKDIVERVVGMSPEVLATKEPNGELSPSAHLSPKTIDNFAEIRNTISHSRADSESTGSGSVADENLERLNELMRSMAQKESHHREVVDDLTTQLTMLRRQHDELTTLSKNQALNMSAELEGLRSKHEDTAISLADLEKHESELLEALQQVKNEHAATVEHLRAEHEAALRSKEAEVDQILTQLKAQHEAEVVSLRAQLADASSALDKAHQEHTVAFGKLKSEHEEELQRRSIEVEQVLARLKAEHEATLAKAATEHQEALLKKDEEATEALHRTEEEYYNALTKLRDDHARNLEKQAADAAATLARLREEHEGALRTADMSREASMSVSESGHVESLKTIEEEHSSIILQKETAFHNDLDQLKLEHVRAFHAKEAEHEAALVKLRNNHTSALSELRVQLEKEVETLRDQLQAAKQDNSKLSEQAQADHDAAMTALRQQQAEILQEVERGHEQDVSALKATHEAVLAKLKRELEDSQASMSLSQSEIFIKLRAEHQQSMTEINARLAAVQDQHAQDLEESRAQSERHATEERERLQRIVSELEEKHNQERELIRKDRELLSEEVAAHKAAAQQHVRERDELQKRLDALTDEFATIKSSSDGHAQDRISLQSAHDALTAEVATHKALAAQHASQRDVLQRDLDALVQESAEYKAQVDQHAQELEGLRTSHSGLSEELAAHKSIAEEIKHSHQQAQSSHERALTELDGVVISLKQSLDTTQSKNASLEAELAALRAELESAQAQSAKLAQENSKQESMATEVENQRSLLAEVQEELQRTREERDILHIERNKQETTIRDLETKLTRSSSPSGSEPLNLRARPSGSVPPPKLPPITLPPRTPPPSGPLPSAPSSAAEPGVSSVMSSFMSSTSSYDSHLETPTSATTPSATPSITTASDPKLVQQIAQQSKQLDEQETIIKTLNKQLTHCESDLQAHMDLVSTLETSLGDAEKNLRKARMHATELARERDALTSQVDGLRRDLTTTKREVATVRQSVVEEKLSLESKLDEERRAKERARAQLDTRTTEMTKRKSKFACL